MSYGIYANYRLNQAARVPFADLVQPLSYVGEGVYMALEAATRLVGRSLHATVIKARERAAVQALEGLDDRMLADIGVPRSEIRVLARKLAENPNLDHHAIGR